MPHRSRGGPEVAAGSQATQAIKAGCEIGEGEDKLGPKSVPHDLHLLQCGQHAEVGTESRAAHTPGTVLGGSEQGPGRSWGPVPATESADEQPRGELQQHLGPHCPSEHMATASLPASKYGTNIASVKPILKPLGKGSSWNW